MLDVMLHLAFVTYVNLGEKVDEKKWVLFDAGFDNCSKLGWHYSNIVNMIWFVF